MAFFCGSMTKNDNKHKTLYSQLAVKYEHIQLNQLNRKPHS